MECKLKLNKNVEEFCLFFMNNESYQHSARTGLGLAWKLLTEWLGQHFNQVSLSHISGGGGGGEIFILLSVMD